MSEVNRCVAIIMAKQPFIDWLKSLPEPTEITIDQANLDNTAFLLQECGETNQSLEIIEDYYELIFEEQLFNWWTNQKHWPKNRDFKTFLEWFDVRLHSMVFDLVNEPLEIYE